MIKRKLKKCAAEHCDNSFLPFKTTDKFCSANCAYPSYKPLKRTPLKPSTKPIPQFSKKSIKFENEFNSIKKKLKEHIVKQYGKLCCEKCFTQHTISFSVHHIVFRSEKPNHEHLNHPKNLIHLCYKCHASFHLNKKTRNYLIEERALFDLFGNEIWGYPE